MTDLLEDAIKLLREGSTMSRRERIAVAIDFEDIAASRAGLT